MSEEHARATSAHALERRRTDEEWPSSDDEAAEEDDQAELDSEAYETDASEDEV